MDDMYVIKDGQKLRCGYTTGSCAAAASKAAAQYLKLRAVLNEVTIDTPAGVKLTINIEKCYAEGDGAVCSVKKDSGDDPDMTDGIEIYSRIMPRTDGKVCIAGGEGIGRITHKGFWGEKGEWAINPVPRKMIQKEVLEVMPYGADVIIFAPEGTEIGKKTFNANIGIEGGISIIGTTGIVEPMSEEAFKKTIYIELDSLYERGIRDIVLYPGNYGENKLSERGVNKPGVKVANFIGDAMKYATSKGFKSILLFGHIGKLCKVSIGCFNTHSKMCDTRMEAFVYYLALAGADNKVLRKTDECTNSEEALNVLLQEGYESVIKSMVKGAEMRLKRYVKNENIDIKVIMYSMEHGILQEDI